MAKRYCVVGSGVAGASAAEQLRRLDADAQIQLINGEPHSFYRRLSLASYLQKQTDFAALTVRKPEDFAAINIELVQDFVNRVDSEQNKLHLASGKELAYDGLLIATGGGAIAPRLPGINLDGVRVGFWDMEDTLWYESHAVAGQPAVVIGGGVLGLELADCLQHLGMKVTIVQLGQTLGEPLTDAAAGEIVGARVKAAGTDYRLGVSAEAILGDELGRVRAVVTSTGEEIPATVVGMCIGIRPNVKWLEGSGVLLEQGCIRVNEYLQTNIPNIYGAGDCTIIRPLDSHLHTSNMVGYRANRTWQVATNQGLCAANNMFSDHGGAEGQGERRLYDEGMFYNAGVLYDLPYTMLGLFNPDANDSTYQTYIYDTAGDPFAYFKLTVAAGRLVGAMLIGKQRRTNILRRIMEGHYIVTGHEHELMDPKFKPNDLPVAPVHDRAGDADVEAKLAMYAGI